MCTQNNKNFSQMNLKPSINLQGKLTFDKQHIKIHTFDTHNKRDACTSIWKISNQIEFVFWIVSMYLHWIDAIQTCFAYKSEFFLYKSHTLEIKQYNCKVKSQLKFE